MERTSKLSALVLVVILAACGAKSLLQGFRAALAGSDPLVNSLVDTGTITPAFANLLRTDFREGVGCADELVTEFSVIQKGDPEAKRKKLTASVRGARCFKVIVDRQNFAKNSKTKRVSDIAEGILASLVVFYSEPGEIRASVSRNTVTAVNEKELEAKLKIQVDELKAAMK